MANVIQYPPPFLERIEVDDPAWYRLIQMTLVATILTMTPFIIYGFISTLSILFSYYNYVAWIWATCFGFCICCAQLIDTWILRFQNYVKYFLIIFGVTQLGLDTEQLKISTGSPCVHNQNNNVMSKPEVVIEEIISGSIPTTFDTFPEESLDDHIPQQL